MSSYRYHQYILNAELTKWEAIFTNDDFSATEKTASKCVLCDIFGRGCFYGIWTRLTFGRTGDRRKSVGCWEINICVSMSGGRNCAVGGNLLLQMMRL